MRPLWQLSDFDLSQMFAFGNDVTAIAARFEQARRNTLDYGDMPAVPRISAYERKVRPKQNKYVK